jgi:hypothetical protein
MPEFHAEPYVYLAGLTHKAALIAWGAGGKVRLETPSEFSKAQTSAWASAGHFLFVEMDRRQMIVSPIGEIGPDDTLSNLRIVSPDNQGITTPIIIPRA